MFGVNLGSGCRSRLQEPACLIQVTRPLCCIGQLMHSVTIGKWVNFAESAQLRPRQRVSKCFRPLLASTTAMARSSAASTVTSGLLGTPTAAGLGTRVQRHSVCRSARLVNEHPVGPPRHIVFAGEPLPLLRFNETSPVFFDERTPSLRNGVPSIYRLDGRIQCQGAVEQQHGAMFATSRVHESILQRSKAGAFELLIDSQKGATTRPARWPAGELFSESLPDGLQVEEVQ